MKRQIFAGLMFSFLLSASTFASLMTEIYYTAAPIDPNRPNRWQYTYDVKNISLTVPIEEFTIWFDFGLYDNLAIETPDPPASNWSEIVIQPEPVLQDDGAYDAKALRLRWGVGIVQTVSGFAVSFDWLGEGEPGSQFYEIIDPVTYQTIDSGYTIPEPATILLLGLGGLVLRKKK